MSAPSGRDAAEVGPAAFTARRMPTRVSNACRRCRRNKSRCDSFRPCSLCLRADARCETAQTDEHVGSRASDRSQNHGRSTQKRRRSPSRDGSGNDHSASVPPTRQRRVSSGNDTTEREEQQPARIGRLVPEDDRRSWAPVNYRTADSAMSIARTICRLGSQNIDDHQTSAIPGGGGKSQPARWRAGDKRLPISTILGSRFPEQEMVYSLLEDYFDAVHWFSLVIYERHFRQHVRSVEDGYAYPAEAPFLTLLSMVLCMAAWYRSKKTAAGGEDLRLWSAELLKIVESRLIQLMDDHSIPAVQTCILLGSHYVYHGRPRLSFALLGATVKMSQAMGLHRNSARGSFGDTEERKRIWWTIYTWDRFASISYGRPLSINDEDCNVGLPTALSESPYFVGGSVERELPAIIYSSYQTELSKLYLIASPALKTIFGTRATQFATEHFNSQYASLVSDVAQKLIAWRCRLPAHLALDLGQDYYPENASRSIRAHTLQSLSLQLTLDNLLIVLHRPILAEQVEHLSMNASASYASAPEPGSPLGSPRATTTTSHTTERTIHDHAQPASEESGGSDYCWSAAVRTARLTELPQLAQLATDSHLIALVAMNLFHAAIVLISVALMDPLSNRSQGVKRIMTRVLRLQELLGQQSTLSSQSTIVLKNLICLLLRREEQAMLGPVASAPAEVYPSVEQQVQGSADTSFESVEKTVRLPMEAMLTTSDHRRDGLPWSDLGRSQRLHESLVSIQRVFPTSLGELPQTGIALGSKNEADAQGDPGLLPQQQVWQTPFGQRSGYQEPDMEHQGRLWSEDYEGRSLFWLWDANWGDAPYPGGPGENAL